MHTGAHAQYPVERILFGNCEVNRLLQKLRVMFALTHAHRTKIEIEMCDVYHNIAFCEN